MKVRRLAEYLQPPKRAKMPKLAKAESGPVPRNPSTTTAVGVDDTPRQRSRPVDEESRQKALEEIKNAVELLKAFQNGDAVAAPWRVPAKAISGRMGVKACLPESGALVETWTDRGMNGRARCDQLRRKRVVSPTSGGSLPACCG
ncbi:hypothetical protein [Leifsonia shinshuensis]